MLCDVCSSPRAETLYESHDRRFGNMGRFCVRRCCVCGLVRTEPQPENLENFYPQNEYYSYRPPPRLSDLTRAVIRRTYGYPVTGPAWLKNTSVIVRPRLAALLGLPPGPPGDLLDIGSGSGALLIGLEDVGWRCHGVEIDEGAVTEARRAGLAHVRQGDLLETTYPERSFDVVRFWHSLEHTRSPRTQLQTARTLLRAGGRLVVGVPNFSSMLSRVSRERWFYLDVPRHLWHFESSTLRRLCTNAGFAVRSIKGASYSAAILGTLAFARGRDESLVHNRAAWFGVQPIAAALDLVHLGDDLNLVAELSEDVKN